MISFTLAMTLTISVMGDAEFAQVRARLRMADAKRRQPSVLDLDRMYSPLRTATSALTRNCSWKGVCLLKAEIEEIAVVCFATFIDCFHHGVEKLADFEQPQEEPCSR